MTTVGSIQRVGQILDLFTIEHPEWGVTQVATQIGVSKSSAHALLLTLSHIGLLRRTPENRYQLGWRVLTLSRVIIETTPLRAAARPVLERLITQYGETVQLAALASGRVVTLDRLPGNRAVRVDVPGAGNELPGHATAPGKVLLADLNDEELRPFTAAHGLPGFTHSTITTPGELTSELRGVREQGYAYDIEESARELCGIAVPVRYQSGGVVAALGFAVPAHRFHESKVAYRNTLLEAAKEIEERLG